MKFYKVVDKEDLGSARICKYDSELYRVFYKLNEFIFAPRTKKDNCPTRLFVFEDLEEAKKFANDDEVIYECEVINPIKLHPSYYIFDSIRFWKKISECRRKKKKIDTENIILVNSFKSCYGCLAVKLMNILEANKIYDNGGKIRHNTWPKDSYCDKVRWVGMASMGTTSKDIFSSYYLESGWEEYNERVYIRDMKVGQKFKDKSGNLYLKIASTNNGDNVLNLQDFCVTYFADRYELVDGAV